jgi:pyruvate dehydrogenase E2 component (dihydrolipoamide acetyltransferase)
MGMFGVESFAAIINPPQAAIVAVSSIMQRAIFKDDEVVPVSLMKLTLSADHRISNGAEGAQYLAEVKRLLEHPMTLVV